MLLAGPIGGVGVVINSNNNVINDVSRCVSTTVSPIDPLERYETVGLLGLIVICMILFVWGAGKLIEIK